MHAVHARLLQPLQFFGGGHVRQHHELFDQPVAIQARARRDVGHASLVVQHHLALRDVQIERAALVPRGEQRAEGGIEGWKEAVRQAEPIAGLECLLHLRVGQPRCGFHQAAAEFMPGLLAVGADTHLHEQAAALLVRAQAAPAIGELLRQHGHDPVGEIAAIAALPRCLVQRRVRAHVMRHVGDGHDQPESIAVRLGIHRVVEIARILAIDGDQRHVAQIGCVCPTRHRAPSSPRPALRVRKPAECRGCGCRSG